MTELAAMEAPPRPRRSIVPAAPEGRLAVLSVLAAVLPVAVAVARGIKRGWLPVSENAVFQVLGRDVFTDHPPLLGLASSASEISDITVHHPGPLLFDLLAIPVTAFGGPGVAVGIGLLNCLSIVGIAIAVHRRGGPSMVTLAMATVAVLCWTMGSELLFEPWQPHSALLPFLCFLVLAWSVSSGDHAALPFMVGVGSLVLQMHVGYLLLIPLLGLAAVVGLVAASRAAPAPSTPSTPSPRALRRAGAVALVVVAVCWVQPAYEQVFADGPGNLTQLATSADNVDETVGLSTAVRMSARVVALPPWFLRPSFDEGWRDANAPLDDADQADLPSRPVAAAALLLLLALVAAVTWDAHRRSDRIASRLLLLAAMALLLGIATATRAPLGVFGLSIHLFRWLWAIAALMGFAFLVALFRRQGSGRGRSFLVVAATAVAVVAAVANLPSSDHGTIATPRSIEAVRDLNRQLGGLPTDQTLLVDVPETFNDPYGGAVMAELQRRDVDFVVDRLWERQLGASRHFEPGRADAVLRIVTGDEASAGLPGTERVAFHDGSEDGGPVVGLFLDPRPPS